MRNRSISAGISGGAEGGVEDEDDMGDKEETLGEIDGEKKKYSRA